MRGARGSGVRVFVPVITGGYQEECPLADGSSLPHPWEAARIFLAGTTARDQLQLEVCRAIRVAPMGHCQLCHCPSTVVALVPAASPQLQRTSSFQFTALLCWVGQPGVGTCRCKVPDWGCAVTVEWQTRHLPGGEEMKGWTVFTEGWGCTRYC